MDLGADFLNTTIGAKPSSMGQASTAITNDINAVQTNPAGLANLNTKQIGAMRSKQYFDTTQDFIGFAFPQKTVGTLALSITRLTHEKIEGRTTQRQTTQGFTASDQTINLSAGKSLTPQTNAGINLKLITSEIAGEKAQTGAIDLGITHKFKNKPITAGITARNIGPGLKYINQRDPLPLSITLQANLGANRHNSGFPK